MSKIFFDVFPTLKVNEEIRMLFESVQVEKVSTNRQRDLLMYFVFRSSDPEKTYLFDGRYDQRPVICQSACESDDF